MIHRGRLNSDRGHLLVSVDEPATRVLFDDETDVPALDVGVVDAAEPGLGVISGSSVSGGR